MKRTLNTLFRGVEILMAVFLAAMVLLVFLNVILRYFFATGLAWSEEVARLCFIYLVYLGAVGAFRENRHLGMHSLVQRVPEPVQKVLYTVVQAIIVWVMVLLVLGSWDLAVQSLDDRWVATQYPKFLIHGIGVVTGAAISLIALANLYRLFVMRMTVGELLEIPEESGEDLTAGAANEGKK